MRRRRTTENDRIGHLFAIATARLEDAHMIAVAGQSPHLTTAQQLPLQRRLLKAIERCREAAERIAAAGD